MPLLVLLFVVAFSGTAAADASSSSHRAGSDKAPLSVDQSHLSDKGSERSEQSRLSEARSLFKLGHMAFNEGRFEDAIEYFERSYELSRHPDLLYNIGQAADRLRKDERALAAFQEYIKRIPDAPNRQELLSRIKTLREIVKKKAQDYEEGQQEETQQVNGNRNVKDSLPIKWQGRIDTDDKADGRESLFATWWFWTGVGVVVAGVVITAIVLSDSGDSQGTQPPDTTTGVVITTLEIP